MMIQKIVDVYLWIQSRYTFEYEYFKSKMGLKELKINYLSKKCYRHEKNHCCRNLDD